ncbi:cytochrome c3 family protein, partial [Stenotrophomonas sp. GbtcB23]|uniref:cytochrome c3 family protein n=1 Tax=Stenotrophomonas sp. GbtcB23 TaxID=2824768 RepID=UPI001C2F37AD
MSLSALEALEFHLPAIIPPALAQAQQSLLIDRHTTAGLVCSTCHGAAAFNEPVAEATCTQCHGNYAALAAKTPWEPNPH